VTSLKKMRTENPIDIELCLREFKESQLAFQKGSSWSDLYYRYNIIEPLWKQAEAALQHHNQYIKDISSRASQI
jgi:hypothetical protein